MNDGQRIEAAIVALAGVHSMCELYGARHAATLRQADEAARLLESLRGKQTEVTACLMPGKFVMGSVSHVATFPGAIAAIDRLIKLGATSVTIRQGVTMLAVISAAKSLCETSMNALHGLPVQFGQAGIEGGAPDEKRQTGEPAFSACSEQRDAIRSAWGDIREGDGDQVAPLIGLASDIVAATQTGSGTILPMARLADYDEYTFSHTVNVGLLASALAAEAGFSPARIEEITVGALLHDIGKLHIPKEILCKEGPLDDAERAVVMEHPGSGAAMLFGAPGVPRVAAIIAFEHHMNLDGSGYPKRRRPWRISIASQVVHIADVFDAMCTHRPYRRAMDEAKALSIMTEDAGVAYDPQLFKVFVDSVVQRAVA